MSDDQCQGCGHMMRLRDGCEPTALCDTCAQDRLTVLEAREPLVQDVLTKHDALTQCVLHGDGDCENEDAALFEALEKLRKWSPT